MHLLQLRTGTNLVRDEGFLSLWKGLTPAVARGFVYGGERGLVRVFSFGAKNGEGWGSGDAWEQQGGVVGHGRRQPVLPGWRCFRPCIAVCVGGGGPI